MRSLIVAVILGWPIGAPSLFAQDFLKQLEEKLFQKQQDSKPKDTSNGEPSAEIELGPIELPSVLEPESVSSPRQNLENANSTDEPIELPPPSKSAKNNSPQLTIPPRPGLTPKTKSDSAAKVASSPSPSPSSPFPPKPNAPTIGGGGYLGLTVESIPGGGFGLTVVDVTLDSPAWKAGFRKGDRVVGVAGQAVSTVEAFAEQLSRFSPGSPVKFLVDRRGRNANMVAVLQDRVTAGQIQGNVPGTAVDLGLGTAMGTNGRGNTGQAFFGLNVSDMSDAFRRQFSIPAYRGASVTGVVAGSPAAALGLKPGDCIVEIEGTPVQSAESVLDTIQRSKPGQVISISYYRGRKLSSGNVLLVADSPEGEMIQVSPEMLTPQYVSSLQSELERVHNELTETQARMQQLEARLLRMENKR